MRLSVALLSVALATPAAAFDPNEAERWSAEAHVVRDSVSRDTVIRFTRTSPGEWTVRVDCQVTTVATKAWTSHKAQGRARAQNGILVGQAGALGQFVLAGENMAWDDTRCASGKALYGTGD